MSQKLTPEELEQFQTYRSEANRFAAILGEYVYRKTLIEFELDVIKAGMKENIQEQGKFLRDLGEKYGDGAINFETGEISPIQN